MAKSKPTKDEQKKAATTAQVDRKMARKAKNRELNEARHQANKQYISDTGIGREDVVRNVTRIVKKGKKTLTEERTVTKNKRPSKLVRKHRRMMAARNLGHQIDSLTERVGA